VTSLSESKPIVDHKRRRLVQGGAMCMLLGCRFEAAVASDDAALLRYRVFTAKRPGLNRDVPPGAESLQWVANTATLVYGERSAILVDTFLTTRQNEELADAIVQMGRTLTAIYVTHAHGDHFFGLGVLKQRFPQVSIWSTPEVAAAMKLQSTPEKLNARWRKLFPGQIPDVIETAQAMQSNELLLEGHRLVAIPLGHTDTNDSTCLHVPSIGLVLAGDAVYNGIHPFLVESTRQNRPQWLAALDRIAALRPSAVVAGHKVPENDDDPRNIAETRRYIEDFIRLNATTSTSQELYRSMFALYPGRANPGSLWSSSIAAKAEPAL
jgi:glyoxylase-like metal-dependent hydrolase (beta-lactamase superfamily II)